jgi:hypothetical protein
MRINLTKYYMSWFNFQSVKGCTKCPMSRFRCAAKRIVLGVPFILVSVHITLEAYYECFQQVVVRRRESGFAFGAF